MRKLLILTLLLSAGAVSAQVVQDSVRIYFHQGKHKLDSTFKSNREVLNEIDRSVFRLEKVEVVGSASPEGSVSLNKRLSERRASVLFNYLSRYGNLPDSLKTTRFIGRDWWGLVRLVESDTCVPHRQEVLMLLRDIAGKVDNGTTFKTDPFWKLVSFRDGSSYRYMYHHLFPELRAAQVNLWFKEVPKPIEPIPFSFRQDMPEIQQPLLPKSASVAPKETGPFRWAFKTNALYDLLLVPNVGVELGIGKDWSVGANWMYAWWKNGVNRRWRMYGGDIYARRWFGRKQENRPLTGHHAGVYAQLLTYDFCLDKKGYMGGKPGGDLWDKFHYAFGVEYGYSFPITRRLNLDFALGVGYMGGTYHEYQVMDGCKVWQATKNRHWMGPTKAEVSLVWLLGSSIYNKVKGGGR